MPSTGMWTRGDGKRTPGVRVGSVGGEQSTSHISKRIWYILDCASKNINAMYIWYIRSIVVYIRTPAVHAYTHARTQWLTTSDILVPKASRVARWLPVSCIVVDIVAQPTPAFVSVLLMICCRFEYYTSSSTTRAQGAAATGGGWREQKRQKKMRRREREKERGRVRETVCVREIRDAWRDTLERVRETLKDSVCVRETESQRERDFWIK